MNIQITSDKQVFAVGDTVEIRVVALNDTHQPVKLKRRLLVGPNGFNHGAAGPFPVSIDPPDGWSWVHLAPHAFYGRMRRYQGLAAGRYTFHAYLMRDDGPMGTEGPIDPTNLLVAASPLMIAVIESPIIVNVTMTVPQP